MVETEKQLSEILERIADELNISPTMREKAVSSYKAVGKWVGEGLEYDVEISPQGSMNLGTVIRPVNDADDGYDMDLVCLIKNGQKLDAATIKKLVGDRLEENDTYRDKLDDEGKRCWTMNYDGFHMDILPCVPKDTIYKKPESTDIRLTHKENCNTYKDRYSNPCKYHIWFEECMTNILNEKKKLYREFMQKQGTEIEDVPTYIVRTPLQQAIQLLKRHRDLMFLDKDEHAPISIIITTLAAKAYSGESNLYETLCSIIAKMPNYIELRGNEYWIENPAMQAENFADKWNLVPEKRKAFYDWLSKAKEDIIDNPLGCMGLDSLANRLSMVLGEAPVKRALNNYGDSVRKERENGTLRVNGLTGGLTTATKAGSKSVKNHTFYGRESVSENKKI